MSEHSQRMKWWEKFHNKSMNQDVFIDAATSRDVLRAALLRMLHAKVDAMDIDKLMDDIIIKINANYTYQEITDFILHYTPELNKQEEDSND